MTSPTAVKSAKHLLFRRLRLILLLPLCLTTHMVQGQETAAPAITNDLYYIIKDLGRLQPKAINNRGDVVGYHSLWQDFYNSKRVGVVVPYGATEKLELTTTESIAHDINDHGVIAGEKNSRATLWFLENSEGNNIVTYPLPQRSAAKVGDACALGLNNQAVAVGYRIIDGRKQPVLWKEPNDIALPPLPYTFLGMANDINDKGDIVGMLSDGKSNIAVLWQQEEGSQAYKVTSLARDNDLVGHSYAEAINNDGTVAGSCFPSSGSRENWYNQACTWKSNTMNQLGEGVTTAARALGINNESMIVGQMDFVKDSEGTAFVWYQERLYDLNLFDDPESRWILLSAQDINDARFITGVGFSPDGTRNAFLATPDCNRNGKSDLEDIASGNLEDKNDNSIPDSCEVS